MISEKRLSEPTNKSEMLLNVKQIIKQNMMAEIVFTMFLV